MNPKSEVDILAALDALTKEGRRQLVLSEIEKILKENPAPLFLARLARLANRNHAYLLALRILYPVIRDDRDQIGLATAEQLSVYAHSLMSVGALEEATQCLARIPEATGESLLTEAFVHFAKWDYQKSLPVLNKYIKLASITDYQRLVGKINLLAATIVVGHLDDAWNLSESLLELLARNPNYKLLYGNCLELRAQIHICNRAYEETITTLDQSEKALSGQPIRYLLFVNKWRAIARLGLSRNDQDAHELLAKVKRDAFQIKSWETVRDCDFHLARLTENRDLLQRILLGTPYPGFHDRIERIFNIKSDASKDFAYCPVDKLLRPERIGFNVNELSNFTFLSSTSWPLLQVMTRDIYRPPRASQIFSKLYQDQYFDPFTSPQRVRNAVFRFNQWSRNENHLFQIRIRDGEFHLEGPPGAGIICKRHQVRKENWQATLQVFKAQNNSKSFTCAEVARFFGVTTPTALKLIQKGVESGKLQKIADGKNTRYLFYSSRRSLKADPKKTA